MSDGLDGTRGGSRLLGRVLVVSADAQWTTGAADVLTGEGYDVFECRLGARAVEQLIATAPNLVLLDLAVPDRYGMTVCTLIRATNPVAIMAVGERGDEQLVRALAAGADVFVSKRISDRELLARVRALFRRVPSTVASANRDVVRIGLLQLDRAGRVVRFAGREIGTTRREFELLQTLMMRAGRVVSRSDLFDSMRGANRDPQSLNVHVRRLRAKLEAVDPMRRIETVRGVGFRFVIDDDETPDAVVLDLREQAVDAADTNGPDAPSAVSV